MANEHTRKSCKGRCLMHKWTMIIKTLHLLFIVAVFVKANCWKVCWLHEKGCTIKRIYKSNKNTEYLRNQFHYIPVKFCTHRFKMNYSNGCNYMYSMHIFRFYFTIIPRNAVPDCYLNHELVLEFAPLQFFSYH